MSEIGNRLISAFDVYSYENITSKNRIYLTNTLRKICFENCDELNNTLENIIMDTIGCYAPNDNVDKNKIIFAIHEYYYNIFDNKFANLFEDNNKLHILMNITDCISRFTKYIYENYCERA